MFQTSFLKAGGRKRWEVKEEVAVLVDGESQLLCETGKGTILNASGSFPEP